MALSFGEAYLLFLFTICYFSRSPFSAFRESFKNGHFIVCIFSLLALAAGVFSSLAASYFQIVSLPQSENVIVDVAGNVGLGYANLTNTFTPYIAAAGVSVVVHRCFTRQ